jgi:hypothetical protein
MAANQAASAAGCLFASISGPKGKAPKLSQEELQALDDFAAHRPFDEKAYNSAKNKLKTGRKYRGEQRTGVSKNNFSIPSFNPAPLAQGTKAAVQTAVEWTVILFITAAGVLAADG